MPSARYRLIAVTGVMGTSFVAILVRLSDTAPVTIAFFRSVYSLPALAAGWWLVRRRDTRPLPRRFLAGASGLFLAVDLTFWHTSIDHIGAGLATVLVNTQVVFVALIAWGVYGERPTRTAFRLVPLIFAGVVLLSGLGAADAYGKDPWSGVTFGLLGGIFYAFFLLTLRASNRGSLAPTFGPILDSTVGTAVGAFLIGMATPAAFPLALPSASVAWLVLLAVVAQVVGWPLINIALARLPALETSALVLAQPMLTIVWALIVFGEDLSAVQWLGVAIVLGGLLVLNTRGAVEPGPHGDAVVFPPDSGT